MLLHEDSLQGDVQFGETFAQVIDQWDEHWHFVLRSFPLPDTREGDWHTLRDSIHRHIDMEGNVFLPLPSLIHKIPSSSGECGFMIRVLSQVWVHEWTTKTGYVYAVCFVWHDLPSARGRIRALCCTSSLDTEDTVVYCQMIGVLIQLDY